MKKILLAVLTGVLCCCGAAFGEQFSVGQLTGSFTTAVIEGSSANGVVQKFVGDLEDDGYACLSQHPPEEFQDFVYCATHKTSYDEHITIGTTWGVGIDADKARIVVEFTLFSNKKINLNVFPAEFRRLINVIGGKL